MNYILFYKKKQQTFPMNLSKAELVIPKKGTAMAYNYGTTSYNLIFRKYYRKL